MAILNTESTVIHREYYNKRSLDPSFFWSSRETFHLDLKIMFGKDLFAVLTVHVPVTVF